MRKLLNTLFVTTETAYAALDGENVIIKKDEEILGRFPLHILEGIVLFSYAGASPALMGKCAENGICLSFCTPRGRFLARTVGETAGNVYLRKTQYRISDSEEQSCRIARNFIYGKLYNSRQVLERTMRDHGNVINGEAFEKASAEMYRYMKASIEETDLDTLRGMEGTAAEIYFAQFDSMILRNKDSFYFHGRNRRPPLDNVNALLSFVYMLLANQCASALESVGLDSFVGFMHRDRPGRKSLSLDLMEELRPCMADRFVLTLINNQAVSGSDFHKQEDGAVLLTDECRKRIQKEWHKRNQDKIMHPFLKEKIEWGLVPYSQALLLARHLRSDLDGYPPFLWK